MPIYCYECPRCGAKAERLRPMRDSSMPEVCMTCRPGVMRRDLQAERLGSTNLDYAQPIYSDALGVAPAQVAAHRRAHPNIPLTDDGRVILTSHRQRERVLKQLGFHDKGRG